MTHSHVWHDAFTCATWPIGMCVTWLTHMCARHICLCDMNESCHMIRSHVWHDFFTCVTWIIHLWQDTLTCVTWLIHTCDMTHSDMCDMTHSYVWHDSSIHVTWLITAATAVEAAGKEDLPPNEKKDKKDQKNSSAGNKLPQSVSPVSPPRDVTDILVCKVRDSFVYWVCDSFYVCFSA